MVLLVISYFSTLAKLVNFTTLVIDKKRETFWETKILYFLKQNKNESHKIYIVCWWPRYRKNNTLKEVGRVRSTSHNFTNKSQRPTHGWHNDL